MPEIPGYTSRGARLLQSAMARVRERHPDAPIFDDVPLMRLTDALGLTYTEALYAYRSGRMDYDVWESYCAIWRYSAPRFTATVNLPSVRAIWAHLDGAELVPYDVELER